MTPEAMGWQLGCEFTNRTRTLSTMKISILTFDSFNELDSFIALGILNHVKKPNWTVCIAAPTNTVTSMNGVTIQAHETLMQANDADAILFGSGMKTRDIGNDASIMGQLKLDSSHQLIGAQCSGTYMLAKLGLLNSVPACTDLLSKPWVQEAGVEVLNQAFFAKGNVATAGGCLSAHYLAAWVIARLEGIEAAQSALHYVAPVGEKEAYVERAMSHIQPYLN
jgi:transcriptional regulator GlxA family with amidase domain